MAEGYIGIDVGSISTKGVVVDREFNVLASRYLRTMGNPIDSIRRLLAELGAQIGPGIKVLGAGTTGSARRRWRANGAT